MPEKPESPTDAPDNGATPTESNPTHDGVSRRSFLGRVALAGAALATPPVLDGSHNTAHAETPAAPIVPGEAVGAFALAAVGASTAQAAPITVGATARVPVTLNINKQDMLLNLEPRTSLLDALREDAHLTGSKKGCNHGQCGACTVLVNGERRLSCLTLAMTVQGDKITTVEGLANGDDLHPVQAAFLENDAFQCGYCTPGQICSAVAMIKEAEAGQPSHVTPDVKAKITLATLSDDEIRERMSGNICRCGAYANIVAAVKQAAGSPEGGRV